MFRFFFLILLFLVLPDTYLWWNFTRLQAGVWRTLLVLLPTIMTLVCMLLLVCQVRAAMLMQVAFVLMICVAVPKLVFVLTDVVGNGITWHWAAGRQWVYQVARVLAVLMAAVQVYGTAWGWRSLRVAHHSIKVDCLPTAFKGYRVVQISDLHLGTYAGDTSVMEALVDSVNRLQPDLIVFTGDMVNTASSEAMPYIRILQRLRAKDGVLSVLGNHDYCLYQPGLSAVQQAHEVRRLVRMQRMMGWKVLLNEHSAIVRGDDTLYVAGVENIGKPPFPERGSLKQAMKGIPPSACTLLLSHDPWHWRHGVVGKTSVQLTLSGHTHALQMQVGRFSPAAWFMPEWAGLYRKANQQLFVSTGIGGSVPYRLGAWPTIELLVLK